jgi:hypothetical protein
MILVQQIYKIEIKGKQEGKIGFKRNESVLVLPNKVRAISV